MIEGYSDLNEKIDETRLIIDEVSNASKEQASKITNINEAVNQIDSQTQQNAIAANELEKISEKIENLSNNVTTVMENVTFEQDTKKQVCDPVMTSIISSFKTDHIEFKAKQFEKLDDFTSFKIPTHHDCKMGKWIDEQEKNNAEVTKSSSWKELISTHEKVHMQVNNYVDQNAVRASNEELAKIAETIELETTEIFDNLNSILESHCKYFKS